MSCAGNSGQICGGNYAISVYHLGSSTLSTISTTLATTSTATSTPTSTSIFTTSSAPSSTSNTWTNLGCYQDADTRVLPNYHVTSTSNSPTSCQSTCLSTGYSVAGVEDGGECWCASTVASGSTSISSSNCNISCTGNSALSCGGNWAINVYSYSGSTSTVTTTTTTSTHATTTSTTTSTSSSTSTTASNATPTPSKVVVAHHMVGNTYSYTTATWAADIALAQAGGIDGFALNVGNMDWEPARVAGAYAAAAGTSFKLFLSFDMS